MSISWDDDTPWTLLREHHLRLTRRGQILTTVARSLLFVLLAAGFVLAFLHGVDASTPGPIDGCTVNSDGYCLEGTR